MEDVREEPLFCQRVAGLDIAKAEVEVTIRVPSDTSPGRRQQETRTFGTTRRELESLADWLRCWGVTKAGMEATSVIRGRLRVSATASDGPGLPVSPSVTDGLSGELPPRPAAESRAHPAVASPRCRFCRSRHRRVRESPTCGNTVFDLRYPG